MPRVAPPPIPFSEFEATYRGTHFKLIEVDTETFDKCVVKATTKSYDDDGEESEMLDQRVLNRQLLVASLVEPKLTAADLNKLGMRLTAQLDRDARDLHFELEPDESKKKDESGDDDEGNG